MTNQIEKQIDLKAPVTRVWQAITDHREFGQWFKVNFEGPFVPGEVARGNMTHPGYEHMQLEVVVKEIKPEHYFSYTWHPYAVDPKIDYSKEMPTLVEFKLEPIDVGTRLTIIESGFDKVPAERREEAFRMDDHGWTSQIKNIEKHVAGNA